MEGPGKSIARDLNHSTEDGLENAASNSSYINVTSITRALLHPVLIHYEIYILKK